MGKIINKVCSFPNGKYFVFLFLFLLFLFSARFMVTGYGVGGDGEGYYAYLPSVIIDNDLDFENQYLSAPWLNSTNPFKDTEEGSAHLNRKSSNRTPTGYLTNPFPIGSAILWLPFFILSLSLIHFLNLFGLNNTLNGYSALSQYVTMVGSLFYVILGFILTYKLIKKLGPVTIWGTDILFPKNSNTDETRSRFTRLTLRDCVPDRILHNKFKMSGFDMRFFTSLSCVHTSF